MSWSSIIGHEEPVGRLRAAMSAGRLHPALLFEGPEGIGKRLVALTLARALHCPEATARGGDPCGTCRACRAIFASAEPDRISENQSEHPGVRVVSLSRPDEREARFGAAGGRGDVRTQITVSQIRVVLADGLSRGLSSGPRLVIIDPADRMGESAANALLKTLEEPPSGERFVLITAKPSALLPTIFSRCVRFRFGLLSPSEVRRALEAALAAGQSGKPGPSGKRPAAPGGSSAPAQTGSGGPGLAADLDLVVSLAGGRLGRALDLAKGPALAGLRETRALLLDSLEALAKGVPAGTFTVIAGASFKARERDEWIEAMGVLEILLRDLAVLAADPSAQVVNTDCLARLRPLAPTLGPRAARGLARLDSVRSDLRVNVNGRLAAERILLEVAR